MSGRESEFEIVLPATSANLGAAFDAAAIALSLHLRVQASSAESFRIEANGRDAEVCGHLDRNLMIETYRDVLQQSGRSVVPLALQIDNQIPIGKGLGSSAAARLAAIATAVHFGELGWSDARILEDAVRRERHGDNVAACWLGGFALVRSASADHSQKFHAHKLAIRTEWPLAIAIPKNALSTETARAVLPKTYLRGDAVSNVQHAMLLAAAFSEGRADLMREALHDRIHEPYRAPLCPLLEPLSARAGKAGVLGAVLSGAGPSVLVVLEPNADVAAAVAELAAYLESRGLSAELLSTSIEERGAASQRRTIPGFVRN